MKQKIIKILKKFYDELDEDKQFKLAFKLHLLQKKDISKFNNTYLEMEIEDKCIKKIMDLIWDNPKWDLYLRNKIERGSKN